jgi:hypothetical protein
MALKPLFSKKILTPGAPDLFGSMERVSRQLFKEKAGDACGITRFDRSHFAD